MKHEDWRIMTFQRILALPVAICFVSAIMLGLPIFYTTDSYSASAFGTYGDFGQHTEHQRITRAALGCFQGKRRLAQNECFEPASLTALAGIGSPRAKLCTLPGLPQGIRAECAYEVGAVENPDLWQIVGAAEAHCDDADYLLPFFNNGNVYPQTVAQQKQSLVECIFYLQTKFRESVAFSGSLDANGTVSVARATLPANGNCNFGQSDVAATDKCSALLAFGRVLHGMEDFVSHSNWSDIPAKTKFISLANPPELANGPRVDAPPFDFGKLMSPTQIGVPAQFTTGCFSLIPFACHGRITHDV